MSSDCRIISGRKELLSAFHTLKSTDIVAGRIPMRQGEENLLLDLVERRVNLVPSATAQLASRSKAFQTTLFTPWMIPGTSVIYDGNQLLELTGQFRKSNVGKVVLKQDRKNAGIGILLYSSIEEIYTQAANNLLSYPFVLQPYISGSTDLRVIIIGDYREAYTRYNPHNFRNNLHCGGIAEPFNISEDISELCSQVMQRGRFPYAHLDVMLTSDGSIYLAEINLRGGIRGAKITTEDYKKRVDSLEKRMVSQLGKKLNG